MSSRFTWALVLTALAVRLPVLFSHQALLPAVAPWGPLVVWAQPWLDAAPDGWGWIGLGLLGALADAASAVLIARLVERRRLADRLLTPKREPEGWASPGFWAGLAWAAHPVAVMLAGSAGAWQSVALFCLLVAAWNLEYSAHPAAEGRASLAMGLAISVALWPLLLLPLGAAGLLSRRARLSFYRQALFLPLILALPWLLIKDPQSVLAALKGSRSLLAFPGLLRALWAAAGAPLAQLQPLLHGWHLVALFGLLLYFATSFWRPAALLPGMALGAWVWALLAPQLQGPLLLAPLGLALLVPGRLPLRLSVATFVLLLLQDQLPGLRGLQLQQADPGSQGVQLLWAALSLVWLFWVALELLRLSSFARRSGRFDRGR